MSWETGLWLPFGRPGIFTSGTVGTLDATGEYAAAIGRISIAGKATGKTLDTSGSSAIYFHAAGNPTFDNASSVFTVGFQGVDKTTGHPVRPDGTWSARAVITTAANTTPVLTNTSANGHVAVPTAGTITLSHGDEVCFVYEMTTRAGSDSITLSGAFKTSTQYPGVVSNVTGSVAGVGAPSPSIVIVFSDGTLGTIDEFWPGQPNNLSWSDATNPDERGLVFQTPFDCTVDAISFPLRLTDAGSDYQFDLVSDYAGTPVSLIGGPIAMTAENVTLLSTEAFQTIPFSSEVNLTANTDYCMAIKATGSSNVRWAQLNLGHADHRVFLGPSGLTIRGVTRNGGSGAYGSESSVLINPMSLRVSDISIGGGSFGIQRHPGMSGGFAA